MYHAWLCLLVAPLACVSAQSTPSNSTLATRGAALASGGAQRQSFEALVAVSYHEETNPTGLVNFGIAENGAMVDEIATLVQAHEYRVTEETFSRSSGAWGSPRVRKAMVTHVNKYLNVANPFNESEATTATGATALFDLLGFALFNAGDGVLLTRPSFAGFSQYLALKAGVRPHYVSFNGTDQFTPLSVQYYEAALAAAPPSSIRAIVLCNPHNPLGRTYPRDTLIALMKFASDHALHIIVDEVYALSTHTVPLNTSSPTPFTSAFGFDTTPYISPQYIHLLYSMSKDFASSGLKLGALLTKNTQLTAAVSSQVPLNWPGNAMQTLAALILEDDDGKDAFLEASARTAARNSAVVRRVLDAVGVAYGREASAGFFLWVDLRRYLGQGDAWVAERDLGRRFQMFGVLMGAGQGMFAEEAGFFRLCFGVREPVLKEGLSRFVGALGEDEGVVERVMRG